MSYKYLIMYYRNLIFEYNNIIIFFSVEIVAVELSVVEFLRWNSSWQNMILWNLTFHKFTWRNIVRWDFPRGIYGEPNYIIYSAYKVTSGVCLTFVQIPQFYIRGNLFSLLGKCTNIFDLFKIPLFYVQWDLHSQLGKHRNMFVLGANSTFWYIVRFTQPIM